MNIMETRIQTPIWKTRENFMRTETPLHDRIEYMGIEPPLHYRIKYMGTETPLPYSFS